jgi:hypothetical protein
MGVVATVRIRSISITILRSVYTVVHLRMGVVPIALTENTNMVLVQGSVFFVALKVQVLARTALTVNTKNNF